MAVQGCPVYARRVTIASLPGLPDQGLVGHVWEDKSPIEGQQEMASIDIDAVPLPLKVTWAYNDCNTSIIYIHLIK